MGDSKTLIVRADRSPMAGITNPGPHQIYKNPRLTIEPIFHDSLADDAIRVEMIYAGICGSDIHVVQSNKETGYILGSAPLEITAAGRILGHEGIGKVLEVGRSVENIKVNSYVTFESIIICHHCDTCKKGNFNQCEQGLLLGMQMNGLFGQIVDVPAQVAHDISDFADDERCMRAAACIEPAACGFVAASLARVAPGSRVLIFGAGPIGLLTAMLCRTAFGAAEVHLVEPVKFRRDFARKWADQVFDIEEFFSRPVCSELDVIIEASGIVENVDRAFRRLASNSRVVLLARSGRPFTLHFVDHMITNNVSIVGSRGHLCGAFQDIMRLLRAGRLPLHEVVTTVIDGLEELKEYLENPGTILDNNCKVLVKINK